MKERPGGAIRATAYAVWVRGTAIRPVPAYARVPETCLDAVRQSLAEDDDQARARLDEAFERFETQQPTLASFIGEALSEPLDDTALALGYFLALAVWLGFERAHGSDMDEVSLDGIRATEELLTLDEQLRRKDPAEALDTDDVIGMEQPQLLDFVHEHIDATLEAHAEEIDVDDVHRIYRLILIEVLALSYAVKQPAGYPVGKTEYLA